MSFFTALTGLKGAQTDIATTSNNISNVGSTGFKKSRAEFGDIFSTTPLQTNVIGAGAGTKSITQQFSQGNIVQSTNTLDMAISGQGFFAMKTGGNAGQTVYTRNGSFDVNDAGYIVDSNGQFLLGYPVDSDGAVSDTTFEGSSTLQLQSEYGDPKETTLIGMGVNLPADSEVIPSSVTFDANNAETYSASSAVTVFDNMGNPKSATIFYIKTQDPTGDDATFKYDTRMFVDGEEIKPALTRATDVSGNFQFIDRFGQKTTVPTDPAYILEGKGSPLYRADDLSAAYDSTPAMLSGLNINSYLGDGKTVEIVSDPLHFNRTVEYQNLQDTTPADGSPFWGKDFLLIDVDGSGPVSIDIPPGTYNGTGLATEVENALRNAFGDDKKIQLTDNVDEKFTIDIKKTAGDGKSTGLITPIEINIHSESWAQTDVPTIKEGLEMDDFLTHAQILMTDGLNSYSQDGTGIDANNAEELGVNERMFKQTIATTSMTEVPTVSNVITDFDVINVNHLNEDIDASAVARYVAYSNVNDVPEIKAYDGKTKSADAGSTGLVFGTDSNGYLTITLNNDIIPTSPEVLRFQQSDVGRDDAQTEFIDEIGTDEISVTDEVRGNTTTVFTLDFKPITVNTSDPLNNSQDPITILAKPSEHIEAYFQDTAGLVEGVKDVSYSNKIIIREIGNSAKRTSASGTATATSNAAANALAIASADSTDLAQYKLDAVSETVNWMDERTPAFKLGYDETNQRLTFDTLNGVLGKGTGIGFDTFTVYSPTLSSGTNGLGIPPVGEATEVSLTTDDLIFGSPFVADGPEVRSQNKRYGMTVEFDTVANNFNFRSGTTGEALSANTVVGVTSAQSESSIAVGRYNLTNTGARDATDDASYAFNTIGNGSNNVMGVPRSGVEGYTPPTGLVSRPAVAEGAEALMDMTRAFTVTSIANENQFTVVSNGVSGLITIPEGNYKGSTLAAALETRINQMVNPISGEAVGGVEVVYDSDKNNFTFTTATTGERSIFSINGALRFGLNNVPLGLGDEAQVRTPVQAKDELGRPLFISPTGEITTNNQDFVDNMVQDFYPLYLDEGELTFGLTGELVSPITNVQYTGFPSKELTVDFTNATSYDQPFAATDVTQDGYTKGRLTNLEIDSYGNVQAGYSNGQDVVLGKIMIASFANQAGLKQIGNSTFIQTAASGQPELGQAAEDGFGQILSGSLERSNVDITEELVNLITSQRNYQAAAKAIETSTSMTQTIINIRN
jgi:flagellar hook protein FlgE